MDADNERTPHLYDIFVVGLGPAGLRALSYGGLLGLNMLGLDELDYAGGKIPMLYGWKPIKDVGIYPAPTGNEFVEMLLDDSRQYPNVTMKTREKVISLQQNPANGYFTLTTERNSYSSRAIIIAAGHGSIRLNYLPQQEFLFYLGKGLSYYKIRPKECAGKDILVVGGGASAVEIAPYIAKYANHVFLAHRRPEFREDAAGFISDLNHPKISTLLSYELQEIKGRYRVNAVALRNNASGETKQLKIDAIVACLGYEEDLGSIKNWGFGQEGLHGKLLRVNERFETTISGVFAVGECTSPPWHKLRIPLIQTWLSEAVHAVCFAYQHITGKKAFRGYSTLMNAQTQRKKKQTKPTA